jgi:hypothetical protein
MINKRGLLVVGFVLVAWSSAAHSSAQVPCWVIEAYIRSYGGEEAAIKAAKEHGWTDADIAKAKRRCQK